VVSRPPFGIEPFDRSAYLFLSPGPASDSLDWNQRDILSTGNHPFKTAQHSAGA